MINRRVLLLSTSVVLFFTVTYAQTRASKGKTVAKTISSKPVMDVALGRTSSFSGGNISKNDFDRIAPQGIHIITPEGGFIEGFSFTYGERNMYEDSAGNDKPVTEYLTEYCMGDTLSPIISHTIGTRTKPGDTAYYDDIHIRMANGKPALGKAMKFVITR
jgi:hypothetical protein